jgi:molybdenum cofactor synthesis domain-containing protein
MIAPRNDPAPEVALAEWIALLDRSGALEPGAVEHLALADALGRVAAADVVALNPNPPHRCAAMDGIAVQAAATAFAPIVLEPGEYATIDTGEAIDERWDAVVPAEEIAPDPDGAIVRHVVVPGAHVRPVGEDVEAGTVVVEAGERLGPYDLALAAAVGHATLPVRVQVPVAIIPTGDELRVPGARLEPGEIVDSNSVMLAARLREEGVPAHVLGVVRDDPVALEAAVRSAVETHRVVLVLAGSSRGTRDHTAAVLGRCGILAVRRVALRPAHPVLLGAVGSRAVVGVPGYPVSAALTLERFVLPLLDRLSARRRLPLTVRVRVTSELHPRRDSEVVVPLVLEPGDDGIPHGVPQSRRGGALSGLARAGAMLRLPAGGDVVAAGSVVEAEPVSARR